MTSRSLGHRTPLLWLVLPMLGGLAVGQAWEVASPVALLSGALLAAGVALGQTGRPRVWAGALVVALVLVGMASYRLHRARLTAWDGLPPRDARLTLRIDRVFSSTDPKKSAGLATVVRSDKHLRELAGQRLYFSLALKKGEAAPLRTAVVKTVGVPTALPRQASGDGFDSYLVGAGMNFRLTRGRVLAEETPPRPTLSFAHGRRPGSGPSLVSALRRSGRNWRGSYGR